MNIVLMFIVKAVPVVAESPPMQLQSSVFVPGTSVVVEVK